jgi:hypothetical protein
MTTTFPRIIITVRSVMRESSRRCRHLLAVCASILWSLLFAAGLAAQPADPVGAEPVGGINPGDVIPQVPDYCIDPCCQTEVLLLNTGYDHGSNGVYPIGSLDDYWTIVNDQDPSRPVPRPANVIAPGPWAGPLSNTEWIGPNAGAEDRFIGQVTYEKCFCVCRESELTFSLKILVDDSASVYLDGVYQGSTPNLAFINPTSLDFTVAVGPGRHCLDVVVNNVFVIHSGLDIQGTVQGSGLVKYSCCGPTHIDPCITERLALATGSQGWEIVSGPDYNGPYPRCADVIDPAYHGWGAPIAGTTWIGPNPTGENRKDEEYTYRKCFCVAEEGEFTIDLSMMADEQAKVLLDGVSIFGVPSPGWHTPVDGRVRVRLERGCHCFDIIVYDCCGVVTGLDALITITGGKLLRPECCDCDRCHRIEGRAGQNPDMGAVSPAGAVAH